MAYSMVKNKTRPIGRHGRRKVFFQGGGTRKFFLNFSTGGPKVAKFVSSHSKLTKHFFAENFKIPAPPSDAHVGGYA